MNNLLWLALQTAPKLGVVTKVGMAQQNVYLAAPPPPPEIAIYGPVIIGVRLDKPW